MLSSTFDHLRCAKLDLNLKISITIHDENIWGIERLYKKLPAMGMCTGDEISRSSEIYLASMALQLGAVELCLNSVSHPLPLSIFSSSFPDKFRGQNLRILDLSLNTICKRQHEDVAQCPQHRQNIAGFARFIGEAQSLEDLDLHQSVKSWRETSDCSAFRGIFYALATKSHIDGRR